MPRVSALRRNPFAWEVQIRQEVIDDELSRLRELPYSVWRDLLGREMNKSSTGRDNRDYIVTVTAAWASPPAEDIRVTLTLEAPGRHRDRMQESFVIAPDNTFID